MADIKDLVQDFRREGYSDFEISRILLSHENTRGFVDAMRKEGYKDPEVFSFLGLSPKDPDKPTYGAKEAFAEGALALPGVDTGTRLRAVGAAAKGGIEAAKAGSPKESLFQLSRPRRPEPFDFLPEGANKALGLTGEETPGLLNMPERPVSVGELPWAKGTFPSAGRAESARRDEKDPDAPAFGSLFDQALEQYRGARKEYMAENPLTGTVAEVAGALGPGVAVGGLVNRGLQATLPRAASQFMLGNTGYTAGGRAAPGAVALGGRVASNAAQGVTQGATGAAMTSGLSETPLSDQLDQGSAIGGLVGATLGTAGRGIVNALRGEPLSREAAELADAAVNKFGIPLRSSQFTNSPVAKFTERARSGIPFSGQGAQIDAEMDAFTRALSNTFGEDSPNLTRQVMAQADRRIGQEFDRAAQLTTIPYDALMQGRFAQIRHNVHLSGLSESDQRAVFRNLDHIAEVAARNGGVIEGQAYQQLSTTLGRLARTGSPGIKHEAQGIRAVLDDAMQFYAPPEAQEGLRQARLQWKNMKILEDIVETLPVDKRLEPRDMQGLLRAAIKKNPRWAYADQGDLGMLAEIGTNFMKQTKLEAGEAYKLGRTITGADLAAGVLTGGAGAWLHSPGLMASTAAILGAPTVAARTAGARFTHPEARQRLIDRTLRPVQRLPGQAERTVEMLGGLLPDQIPTGEDAREGR